MAALQKRSSHCTEMQLVGSYPSILKLDLVPSCLRQQQSAEEEPVNASVGVSCVHSLALIL